MNVIRVTLSCAAAVLLVTIGTPATAQPDVNTVSERTVEVTRLAFRPATIRIQIGDTVTWMFDGNSGEHNVTATGPSTALDYFASETMSGGSYSHTFGRPGTYMYRCTEHPSATGQVIVR
ncbi:plastocyanin/azurin family copper-binding protein [Rhodococcus sp. NPDC003318]|uniref:cupredoxin domain-containing protein n=1 Tax=Rhodococcus sp. NPDC003318 TaxID=3364503 RepID=UPI00367DDF1A